MGHRTLALQFAALSSLAGLSYGADARAQRARATPVVSTTTTVRSATTTTTTARAVTPVVATTPAARVTSARTTARTTSVPARAPRRAPAPPCVGPVVEVRRANGGFAWRGPLTDCRGRVRAEALAGVTGVASPSATARAFALDLDALVTAIRRVAPVAGWTLAEPESRAVTESRGARAARAECPRGQEPEAQRAVAPESEAAARGASAARGARVRRAPRVRCRAIEVVRDPHTRDVVLEAERRSRAVHPRLIEMLARVAERWPGRVIEVVSGFRPSGDPHAGSRHAHARALDFRVVGVGREALRDFCRTLPLAGVGYYPHSVFVHLDVRDRDEGAARWTDYSEPGERPRYGGWPPRAEDVVREVQHITARVDALLEAAARGEQTRGD
jgi:hypothetical protein